MAAVQPALRFRLSADAIRDVCARPAVLLALAESIPAGAVRGPADRRQAVADGVARALELARDGGEAPLLEEAERRMWEPVPGELARLLQRVGPDGLFAYWIVDGAARREAWRADAQRRRADRPAPLPADAAGAVEHDPIDLLRFRLDVEQAVDATARRTGLDDELVYGLVAHEVSYAEAGRRSGRSANSLWMALDRLRPDWRGVAERGRAAGLGGGVLVHVTDRTDRAVRRVVRWRLVGGIAAATLLAASLGAVAVAAHLSGTTPPPREPVQPTQRVWRGVVPLVGALSVHQRTAPSPARRTRLRPRVAPVTQASPAASSSCGLGTAALSCR